MPQAWEDLTELLVIFAMVVFYNQEGGSIKQTFLKVFFSPETHWISLRSGHFESFKMTESAAVMCVRSIGDWGFLCF